MFTSSPPCGPISICQSSPVTGWKRKPVAVAVAVREDLGLRAGAADERVVGGCRAVVLQAQDLAGVVGEALRAHADAVVVLPAAAEAVAVADADVQRLVGAELHAARVRHARVLPRIRDEDLFRVDELGAVEAAARDAERLPLLVAFHVRHVDELVGREVGVHDDAVQDVVAGRRRRRPHGVGQQLAALDHAQLAVALGHEQVRRAGDEHEVPRRGDAVGDERDADLLPPAFSVSGSPAFGNSTGAAGGGCATRPRHDKPNARLHRAKPTAVSWRSPR